MDHFMVRPLAKSGWLLSLFLFLAAPPLLAAQKGRRRTVAGGRQALQKPLAGIRGRWGPGTA